MKMITLQQIRDCQPCERGWKTLLESKSGVDYSLEFPVSDVLKSNGIADAIWCLRCTDDLKKVAQRFAYLCAMEARHLMPDASKKAIDVVGLYLDGKATKEELLTAKKSAAAAAAYAAYDAADAYADADAYAAADADAARKKAKDKQEQIFLFLVDEIKE